MKKTIFAFAIVALLALGGQAFAELCTVDNVPAATLLIPYFEVAVSEPGDGGGCDDVFAATTFFSVNNASADPVIAHVTMWTNYSVPTLDFDIYLTGYDVQQLDVKNFFCSGNLPQTGSGISNVGLFSNPAPAGNRPAPFNALCDTSTTVGTGLPPNYANPAISFTGHLRDLHTGDPSRLTGNCAGAPTELAVGYLTVDATQICNTQFPDDDTYWTSGFPIPPDGGPNVLWGDYQYLNRNANQSEGFAAVHIEADPSLQGNGPTFYGRYTWDIGFLDGREPLSTTYAGRYLSTPAVGVNTFFQVWREGFETADEFACATPPADIDLNGGLNSIMPFDEFENPAVTPPGGGPSGEPFIPQVFTIPYETQSLQVGTTDLPTPYNNGWYYLNLQSTAPPATSLSLGQAYLTIRTVLPGNNGVFSAGWDGIQLDGQCSSAAVVTPATPTVVNPQEPI